MALPTEPRELREEPTLGELIAGASRDMSELVRAEIQLAKAELRVDVRNGVAASALFVGAGVLLGLCAILFSVAAAYGLVAAGLGPAVSFVIVGGAFLLLALVLAAVGVSRIKRVRPPRRTIRTSKDTARFLKNPRRAPAGDGRR